MMPINKIAVDDQIHEILRSTFGYDEFRPHQDEIIHRALEGKDSLVIMPTGGGKSLCFQIPALVSKNLTVVISPLIALMEDQVRALRSHNIEAAFVNSTQTSSEKREVLKKLEAGILKLLYISPEKALTASFLNYIGTKKVDLVAIDEAHCVSIWGNDFRPEYAKLTALQDKLPNTPIMALTATADKATQLDIVKQLRLRKPRIFLSSFERKNIHIEVRPGQKRIQQITRFLEENRGHAGIIYCLSRKSTMRLSEQLRARGYKSAYYHAQLPTPDKKKVQDAFQSDDLQIICATIAFGMGIDKSNIRWVIHYNLPKNIESYYQEIGRSGRDGSAAKALLFYSYQDISVFRNFIYESTAGDDFKTVQLLKLDRLWEFSQATHCRTNLILNYFGEYRSKSCGHCDICTDPPKGFDGTKLARMALQVCKEAGESIGINMLADTLRASGKKEIIEAGLDKISSYGIGRDIPRIDWLNYITQLINQGLLEIDYTQRSILRWTELSETVEGVNTVVKLSRLKPFESRTREPEQGNKKGQFEDALFQQLKRLRKELAAEEGVPAYVVFADKVLEQMVSEKPGNPQAMSQISGIGDFKLKKYGDVFLKEIQDFIVKQNITKSVKGKSHLETLNMFRDGLTPEEIAQNKGIQQSTVFSHLAQLYEQGEKIDLKTYVNSEELQLVRSAWTATNNAGELSVIREQINEEFPYYKIRIGLAMIRRESPEL